MIEKKIDLTPAFVIDLIIRRRWWILISITVALIGGIYVAKVTPRIYEAKTLILVERQRVPENYVQSIVTEATNEQVNTISHQILSRTNLEKIMNQFSLFKGPEYEEVYIEEKVEYLRDNISVNLITHRRRQTEAFEVGFTGKDPNQVMRVANALAKSFIDTNIAFRELQAKGTSAFLESELNSMRVRLEQVEEEIKEYRKSYMGELPDQLETNLRILERLQDNLSDRQQSYRDAKIRLANIKTQASKPQPSIVVIGGDQVQPESLVSMDELVAELERLQSRYTDEHPDIIRIKMQIERLKSDSSGRGGAVSASQFPPAFRARLLEVQREIDLAQSEIKGIEMQMVDYQKRVENTPRREQEMLSLRRDYQNIQTSYDSLLKRKLEADIAVNMELDQKGAQFRIVDPARIPEKPIKPNLRKLFMMVMAAGFGLGGGVAFLLEHTNTSFRKPDEIESAFGTKVLVAIPEILTKRQKLFKRLDNYGSVTCAVLAIGLIAILGMITIKGV